MGSVVSSSNKKSKPPTPEEAHPLTPKIERTLATRKLDGSSMNLSTLPPALFRSTHLQVISLSCNQLLELPSDISKLSSLADLQIDGNQLICLPTDLARLSGLETLKLKNNKLSVLPESASTLKLLHTLDLSINRLSEFPKAITSLSKLTNLDVSYNYITYLPSVDGLTNLQEWRMGGNMLSSLTPSISCLTELLLLDVHCNHLTSIPEEIKLLSSLMRLHLKRNLLEYLPSTMEGVTSLTDCNLMYNRLKEIPASMSSLPKLRRLYFSFNQIEQIPGWLGHSSSLQNIALEHNPFTEFPSEFLQFRQNATINLSNAKLKTIPETSNPCSAVVLILESNQIESIPPRFSPQLSRLTKLTLSDNKLTTLGELLTVISNLMDFRVSGNMLRNLSEDLSTIYHLTLLDLSSNRISSIPEAIGNLAELKKLSVAYNRLSRLPTKITNLQNLVELYISGNSFQGELSELTGLKSLKTLWAAGLQNPSWDPFSIIAAIPPLTNIDLSRNGINQIPSSMFSSNPVLVYADFSINNISKIVEPSTNISRLRYFHLHRNPIPTPDLQQQGKLLSINQDLLKLRDEINLTPDSLTLDVGYAAFIGRRGSMEDEMTINCSEFTGQILLGVFDGHDGGQSAAYIRQNYPKVLAEYLKGEGIEEAFTKTHLKLQEGLRGLNMPSSGSTSVAVLVNNTNYVVVNSGDSRAILCQGKKAVRLSVDHKPLLMEEEARIRSSGSYVNEEGRIAGLLAVSRGFGDFILDGHVSCEPTVRVYPRQETDSWIVLASDGLWDVLSDERVASELDDETCPWHAAMKLRDLAYISESTDNITVIVARLR